EILARLTELLHDRPQILDLLGAPRDVRAYLVDHERDRLARPPASRQFERLLDEPRRRDLDTLARLPPRPRVGLRVSGAVHLVEHRARLVHLLRHFPTRAPRTETRLHAANEVVQPSVGLEALLQFRDVEVLGVVKRAKERAIEIVG